MTYKEFYAHVMLLADDTLVAGSGHEVTTYGDKAKHMEAFIDEHFPNIDKHDEADGTNWRSTVDYPDGDATGLLIGWMPNFGSRRGECIIWLDKDADRTWHSLPRERYEP